MNNDEAAQAIQIIDTERARIFRNNSFLAQERNTRARAHLLVSNLEIKQHIAELKQRLQDNDYTVHHQDIDYPTDEEIRYV